MSPTNSQPTRQRKTGFWGRLAWMPAVLLVGFVALACSPTDYARQFAGTQSAGKAARSACAEKFMVAVTTNKAAGVYDCLSPQSKVSYFYKFGWTSDADMQQFLSSRTSPTASGLGMKTYAGNPVSESDGQHYLYYVGPKQVDGTVDWTVGVGFDIQVDAQGRIVGIS